MLAKGEGREGRGLAEPRWSKAKAQSTISTDLAQLDERLTASRRQERSD